MKNILTLIISFFILLINTEVKAQLYSLDWAKLLYNINYESGNENTFLNIDKNKNIYIAAINRYGAIDVDPGPGVFQTSSVIYHSVFISKLDSSGNFKWIKNLFGKNGANVYNIAVDSVGSIYTVGHFIDSVDFDPGPAHFYLYAPTCAGSTCTSIFLSKLDSNGNFKWAKKVGGVGVHLANDVAVDANGNVYMCGDVQGMVDLNPDAGVDTTLPLSRTAFLSKYDSLGNYKYSLQFISQFYSDAFELTLDKAGNIYFQGQTNGIADINPGTGIFNVGANGSTTNFLTKLDSSGSFIWGLADIAGHMAVDNFQNFYTFSGNIGASYLTKYNPNGSVIWVKDVGGYPDGQHRHDAITIDKANNVFLTGLFRYTRDFDPGSGVYNLSTSTNGAYNSDCFVSRLDQNGNLDWVGSFGSITDDWGSGIVVDESGNIINVGRGLTGMDLNPDAGINYTPPNFDPQLFLKRSYIQKLKPCSLKSYGTVTVNTCTNFTYNGVTYTNSGIYYQTLRNVYNCDSLVTLNLNIGVRRSEFTVNTCDSYFFNNQTLNNSGIYYDTLTTANGCDSIIKLNLILKYSKTVIIDSAICEGNFLYGYNTSGLYIDTFNTVNGCDSIRKLSLLVKPKKFTNITQTVCQGQTFLGYSSTGTYTNIFVGTNGCDSTRILILNVMPKYLVNETKLICNGMVYNGHSVTGNFIDTFKSVNNCDSIVNLSLQVNSKPNPRLGKDAVICINDKIILDPGEFTNYVWYNGASTRTQTINQSGLIWVKVTNSCGTLSDTIFITTLPCLWKFPNVFTPNNDGKNDYFNILNGLGIQNYNLSVYNRFGQEVFRTNKINGGWNGTFKNILVDSGAYIWKASFFENGIRRDVNGTVILVR